MQGNYVVIEGIDGSGKTTLADNLVKEINETEESAVKLQEPYNEEIIKIINEVKENGDEIRDEETILANLFAADRLCLKDLIFDYTYAGVHVICDRSKYSSYAYQDIDLLYNSMINRKMMDPDGLLYLDIDPKIALTRVNGGDKFETRKKLIQTRNWYRENLPVITKSQNINYAYLDVTPYSPDQITAFFMNALRQLELIRSE